MYHKNTKQKEGIEVSIYIKFCLVSKKKIDLQFKIKAQVDW